MPFGRSAAYRAGRPSLPQRCPRLRAAALLCVRGSHGVRENPQGFREPPEAASRTRPYGRRPNLPTSFFDSPSVIGTTRAWRELVLPTDAALGFRRGVRHTTSSVMVLAFPAVRRMQPIYPLRGSTKAAGSGPARTSRARESGGSRSGPRQNARQPNAAICASAACRLIAGIAISGWRS